MGGSMRLLMPFFRRQWRALAVAGVSTIVVAVAELARPLPLALVIGWLLENRPQGLGEVDLQLLGVAAGLVLLIALVDAICSYLIDVRLMRAGERIVHDLRVATYDHLQRLALGYHERRHAGDLVTRVTGDVSAVGSLFSDSLGTIAASVLSLLGMLVVSLAIDPFVALAAFGVSPVLGFMTFRYRRRMKDLARRQRAKEGEIASLTTEALSAVKVVKAFGSELLESERLATKSEERRAAGIETSRLEGRFGGFIDILGAVGSASVLAVGVVRIAQGAIDPEALVIVTAYARRLYRPLRDIARQAGRMTRSMARAERVAEVLAADEVLIEPSGAFSGGRARGELELRSVSFAYDPERPALRDVSLHIPAGQRVAIIGRSGAGKSTLAALMARFFDPQGGHVFIDGRDVRQCRLSWLRRQVGLVLQDTVLFTGSVSDNIAYGTDATRTDVVAAAKAAGGHGFILELPEGYDTQLGPRGVGLSGGQRQRIAIARTLLRDPPVLILDEPTTALDVESEAQVLRGLDVLMRDRTVVIITHSLELASSASQVVVVDQGRVTREGSPETLLADGSPFEEMTGAPPMGPDDPWSKATDPALPQMPALLEGDGIEPVLRRSLGVHAEELDVRVRYLRYKPGTNLVVQYDVGVDGHWHSAVAMIAAGADLRRRARNPDNVALARRVDGRCPSATPLFHDEEHDVLVQWLPLDLCLPWMAEPPEALNDRLRHQGLAIPDDALEPERLSYKPRRKVALAVGEHVVKMYAREADFRRSTAGLASSSGLANVRTPRLEASLPDLRMTVQTRLQGDPVTDPIEAAEGAGRVLRRLHRSGFTRDPTVVVLADEQLRRAGESADLTAAIIPQLRARLDELIETLTSRIPSGERSVASHGDFHARQLLASDDEYALTDFDAACIAAPALDHATYAAHLVRGDPNSLDLAWEALKLLEDGYGARPAELSWYLATSILRRSPFPFRHLDDRWPQRMAGMVLAAEGALGNGAGQ